MRIGKVFIIDDYYVYITVGSFEIGDKVSNFWYGRYVNTDGSLSEECWHGYDNGYKEVNCKITVETKITFKKGK